MKRRDERTLWQTEQGMKCVIAPYDETRYQLRLVWPEGTFKSDLFASRADAIKGAELWRAQVDAQGPSDEP